MDYKTLNSQFNKIDSELYEFIDSRTEKNMQRGEDIVENYVSALSNNEYSIKSFKAKIIHNELEHRRTSEDFQKLLESTYQNINDAVKKMFDDYLDLLKKAKSSPTKTTDLREYEISKRRQRQEIINRINNLEKEYNSKVNLDLEGFKNKTEDYQSSLQIEGRRLTIDINRIKENTIKSYSSEEKELLVRDDKVRINELKQLIKEKRIEGLKQEYEQKEKSYSEIRNIKRAFVEVKKEHDINMYKQELEHNEKVSDFKAQIKEIEAQIKINSFNYDCNYRIKLHEKLRDSKLILVSLSKAHNDFLYKYELGSLTDDQHSKFIIAFILLKLYQMLITLYENNIYDPLIPFVEELIAINKANNENYGKNIIKIKDKTAESIEQLKAGLELINLDENTLKRMSKDDLSENVISSIERYYNNVIIELSMFNNELQMLMLHTINVFNEYYIKVMEKSIFSHNDCLFLNTHYNKYKLSNYGYQKYEFEGEQVVSIDDYYQALCSKIEEYNDTIEPNYQKSIKLMEKQVNQYDSRIKEETEKYRNHISKVQKANEINISKYVANYNKIDNKKYKKIDREFKKYCDKAKKYNKQKMRVL